MNVQPCLLKHKALGQLFTLQILLAGSVFCGNVLIWPTEGSHWYNVKQIIDALTARNHNVTVLISSGAAYINSKNKITENYVYYQVLYGKNYTLSLINAFVKLWLYEKPKISFYQFYKQFRELAVKINAMVKENCDSVLKNPEILGMLKSHQYDVLISDPVVMCGEVIAEKLDIPFMYSLRFSPASAAERYCGHLPSVPSYNPAFLSELSDSMSFFERIQNIISYLIQDYIFHSIWSEWNSYYSELLDGALGKHMEGFSYPVIEGISSIDCKESCDFLINQTNKVQYSWAVPAPLLFRKFYARQIFTMLSTCFLLLLQVSFFSTAYSGKILAWPTDGSHFMNLNTILEKLAHKGHEVTVLVNSANIIMDTNKTSALKFEVFPVAFTKERNEALLEEFLRIWIYDLPHMSYWEFFTRMKKAIEDSTEVELLVCDGVVKNKELLKKLNDEKFDILVADPLAPCGELIAEMIGVPFVYSFRFSMANIIERLCGQQPMPYSYVPGIMTELTDRMSFIERMRNTFFFLSQDAIFYPVLSSSWNAYYSEALGRPTTFCEVMGKAEIWLIRTYWDFEYPRPILPNFEYVGGLHCKPAKPLPEEMEKVVQSSGEHGIVVFSLGSMVKNLTEERNNVIAAALSQLPQKVIWRYSGKRPETLGENTMIYDWIPQNDLLGHPKTKAFITHGGTNGIYEAIYHGIPMVGIPLFADQPDNMIHMKTKGMAVIVDINKMTSQDLVDAVNTVINNPTYKENALRISQIHHDQPMKPLDRAVFWIEFVMRHKGAKHLRPASHDLTWYQYHCLDVIGLLLAFLFAILYINVKIFLFCCRKCRPTKKKQKKH